MHKFMKTFYTDNPALLDLLSENGFYFECDEQMRVIVSDEDAERIPPFVDEHAPAAFMDYAIEDL